MTARKSVAKLFFSALKIDEIVKNSWKCTTFVTQTGMGLLSRNASDEARDHQGKLEETTQPNWDQNSKPVWGYYKTVLINQCSFLAPKVAIPAGGYGGIPLFI